MDGPLPSLCPSPCLSHLCTHACYLVHYLPCHGMPYTDVRFIGIAAFTYFVFCAWYNAVRIFHTAAFLPYTASICMLLHYVHTHTHADTHHTCLPICSAAHAHTLPFTLLEWWWWATAVGVNVKCFVMKEEMKWKAICGMSM